MRMSSFILGLSKDEFIINITMDPSAIVFRGKVHLSNTLSQLTCRFMQRQIIVGIIRIILHITVRIIAIILQTKVLRVVEGGEGSNGKMLRRLDGYYGFVIAFPC